MGKNRDRLSIIAAILEASNNGASKTRIMFSANLSFKLLEKYLEVVKSIGYIQIQGSTYRITDEGKEFLKHYKQYNEKYAKIQDSLESLSNEHEILEKMLNKSGMVSIVEEA